MKKTILILSMILLLSFSLVSAHGEETFTEAEEIIESKISCDGLTDEQLESIGDYYMEQLHPGEAHEAMDEMMGGEGSENLKQMHINMAKSFYCGEHDVMSSGMMDTMMGRGMMSGGMMGGMMNIGGKNKMAYGMMGTGSIAGWWLVKLLFFVAATFVFSAIFWLTHNWLVKGKKRK